MGSEVSRLQCRKEGCDSQCSNNLHFLPKEGGGSSFDCEGDGGQHKQFTYICFLSTGKVVNDVTFLKNSVFLLLRGKNAA